MIAKTLCEMPPTEKEQFVFKVALTSPELFLEITKEDVPMDIRVRIEAELSNSRKINAIKVYRDYTGYSLKVSKEYIDTYPLRTRI